MTRSGLSSVLQWVMTAAFALSVVVQYNDPDPLQWMLMYGAAGVATAWAALRPREYPWWLPTLVGMSALVWAVPLLPQVIGRVRVSDLFASWEMKNTRVEVAREAGGLLIVAAWMVITAVSAMVRPRPSAPASQS